MAVGATAWLAMNLFILHANADLFTEQVAPMANPKHKSTWCSRLWTPLANQKRLGFGMEKLGGARRNGEGNWGLGKRIVW